MQLKPSEKYNITKQSNNDLNMSDDTFTRWMCLLEGIDIVSDKMKQYGNRLTNEDNDWIKPIAFQKYITERFESMKYDLSNLEEKEEHVFNTYNTLCTTSLEPALA